MTTIQSTSSTAQEISTPPLPDTATADSGPKTSAPKAAKPADGFKPSSTSLSQIVSGGSKGTGAISMQRRLISSDGPVPVVEGLSFPKDASFISVGTVDTPKGTVEIFSIHEKGKPLGTLRILPATGEARFTPATR